VRDDSGARAAFGARRLDQRPMNRDRAVPFLPSELAQIHGARYGAQPLQIKGSEANHVPLHGRSNSKLRHTKRNRLKINLNMAQVSKLD
jgi:hypothetical protein